MKLNKKAPGFFTRLFGDLYTVTLYTQEDDGSTGTVEYELKELKKINPNYLKGVGIHGEKIEFKTQKPFDYKVVKHY